MEYWSKMLSHLLTQNCLRGGWGGGGWLPKLVGTMRKKKKLVGTRSIFWSPPQAKILGVWSTKTMISLIKIAFPDTKLYFFSPAASFGLGKILSNCCSPRNEELVSTEDSISRNREQWTLWYTLCILY